MQMHAVAARRTNFNLTSVFLQWHVKIVDRFGGGFMIPYFVQFTFQDLSTDEDLKETIKFFQVSPACMLVQ